MGKFLIFSRNKLKFCSWLYKKRWHTLWKFQLEIRSNKKVIAKKPLTNLYEMNSRFDWSFTLLTSKLRSKWERDFIMSKTWLSMCARVFVTTVHISYKFVKGFLAITFLLLVISNWNFHDVCQCFLYNKKRNFSWIRQ